MVNIFKMIKVVEAFGAEVIKLGMPMKKSLGGGEFLSIFGDAGRIGIRISDGSGLDGLSWLDMVRGVDGIWQVKNVAGSQGYGPLLYDIAMEFIYKIGDKGLMSDRVLVSEPARAVWDHYYKLRGDIGRERLSEKDIGDEGQESLKHYYYKSNSELMDGIIGDGKFYSEDFDFGQREIED